MVGYLIIKKAYYLIHQQISFKPPALIIIVMSNTEMWISEGIKAYIPEGFYLKEGEGIKPTQNSRQLSKNECSDQKPANQIRQAMENQLREQPQNKSVETNNWEKQQLDTLLNQFAKLGPKWNIISQSIPKKSNNTIKNKFYGKLRKVTRRLNQLKKQKKILKKTIKYESVLRIIQPTKCLMNLDSELRCKCQELRFQIIELVKKSEQEFNLFEVETLIDQINKFNLKTRSYRTKLNSASHKRSSAQKTTSKLHVKKQPSILARNKAQQEIILGTQKLNNQQQALAAIKIKTNEVKVQLKLEQVCINQASFVFPFLRFDLI